MSIFDDAPIVVERPICAGCGRPFERHHPSQRFHGKDAGGRRRCKDRFHNAKQFRAAVATGDHHRLRFFGTSIEQITAKDDIHAPPEWKADNE